MDQELDGKPFKLLTATIQKIEKPLHENNMKANKRNPTSSTVNVKKPASREKERMTVQISKNTIERLKDCVYWKRGTFILEFRKSWCNKRFQ